MHPLQLRLPSNHHRQHHSMDRRLPRHRLLSTRTSRCRSRYLHSRSIRRHPPIRLVRRQRRHISRRPPMVGRPGLRHIASHPNHPCRIKRHHPPQRASQNRDIRRRQRSIKALRIGDMTLVSTDQSHPIEFAANLRTALSETKLLVSTNPAGEPTSVDQRSVVLAKTVELVKQSGIYP